MQDAGQSVGQGMPQSRQWWCGTTGTTGFRKVSGTAWQLECCAIAQGSSFTKLSGFYCAGRLTLRPSIP